MCVCVCVVIPIFSTIMVYFHYFYLQICGTWENSLAVNSCVVISKICIENWNVKLNKIFPVILSIFV